MTRADAARTVLDEIREAVEAVEPEMALRIIQLALDEFWIEWGEG